MYLCSVDVPELSTYRHIYAAISKCVSGGVYNLEKIPAEIAEKLLKQGELVLTEVSEELIKLIGIDQLEGHQYLRVVLLRD